MTKQKLPIGTVLYTKDGRQVGNSIIVDHINDSGCDYLLRTDYGNETKCSAAVIPVLFYIGEVDKTHKHHPKQIEGLLTIIDRELFSDALKRVNDAVSVLDLPKAAKSIDEASAILEKAKLKLFEA